MLACQSVMTSPQGRAALLRDAIIGRIAKEFLSIDGALDGPSVEVTAHRVGYIAPSNDDTRFCDDHLMDNEIAIICGTYSLYTGEFYLCVDSLFFKHFLQWLVKLLCGCGFPRQQLGKHFTVDAIG